MPEAKPAMSLADIMAPFAEAPALSAELSPIVEHMLTALERPNGIAIRCTSESVAKSMRWKYYNARKKLRKEGNVSFDTLLFQVVGERLIITNPRLEIEEL